MADDEIPWFAMDPNFTAPCTLLHPEIWFSDDNYEQEFAIRICQECPKVVECLQYATINAVDGIWGGTRSETRRQIRKKLGIKAKPLRIGTSLLTVKRADR